jgi:PH (Pleckstrin Homology) domain-containing protein
MMAIHAPDMTVDRPEQLEKIESICLEDETILAVFDMKGRGTGFIGITDLRIIYYDKEFLRKKKALVSIPFNRITSVASEDSKGFLIKKGFFISDTLTIITMGQEPKEFEFRGGDKAHLAHNLIMKHLLRQ